MSRRSLRFPLRRRAAHAAGLAFVAAALTAAPAAAQHAGDVQFTVEQDTLVTNSFEGSLIEPQRVFLGRFGDSGFPGFTSNPGFEAASGTLPIGDRFGWSASAGLAVWDGAAVVPATDRQVVVSFASAEFVIADQPVEGFDLALQSSGGLHRHLNLLLETTDGDPAEPGVYVIEMENWLVSGSPARCEPYWMVFAHMVDDTERAAAADWLLENLPGPACVGDLDGDDAVGIGDLLAVLAAWGAGAGAPADLDGDGLVGIGDLLSILAAWGPCPG